MKEFEYKMDAPHGFENNTYKKNSDECRGYDYMGLTIHAGKGIHEYAFNYIQKIFPKKSKVLILGAGTGSFDCRLYSNGFTNITSVDINFDNYQYKNDDIKFVNLDLNSDFNEELGDQKFDLIVAIEIVEHLYSTHAFLQSVKKLLSDSGSLVCTTPNPRSMLSRLKFFTIGFHNRFYSVPMKFEHINPIHMGIMVHHCHFNNLSIKHFVSFDDNMDNGFFKKVAIRMVKLIMRLVDIIFKNNLEREQGQIILMRLTHSKE